MLRMVYAASLRCIQRIRKAYGSIEFKHRMPRDGRPPTLAPTGLDNCLARRLKQRRRMPPYLLKMVREGALKLARQRTQKLSQWTRIRRDTGKALDRVTQGDECLRQHSVCSAICRGKMAQMAIQPSYFRI